MSESTRETSTSRWLWRAGLVAILVFTGWCLKTIFEVQRMRADVEEHVVWLIEIQSISEASEADDPQWPLLRDRLELLREDVSSHPDSLGDGSGLATVATTIDAALAALPGDSQPTTAQVDALHSHLNSLVRRIRGRTGGLSAVLSEYWNSLIALALSALLLLAVCGALVRRLSNQRHALAEANRHLSAAKLSAEAANRSKGEFLADVSHEIRTPMNAILGMTHLVLESPLASEQRKHLQVVRASAEGLLGLVNGLLDLSKIDAGRLEIESAAFDLRACVGGVLQALAMGAAEKGLELVGEVAPQVPQQIFADEARLRQTLLNLVGNAIKFTDKGEVVVRIEAVETPANDTPQTSSDMSPEFELVFSVQDTGIGIAADKLEEIFVAFKQADVTTSRRFGGTGLGLPISKRLVGLMGGSLTCTSQPGHGSNFTFTLPTRAVGPWQDPMYMQEKAALSGRRLVVIEPNPIAANAITRAAESWGMEVEAVAEREDLATRLRGDGQASALIVLNGDDRHDHFDWFQTQLTHEPTLAARTLVIVPVTVPRERFQRFSELGLCYLTKPVLDRDLRTSLAGVATNGELSREPSGPAPGPQIEHPGLKILVVDDSATNRMLAVGLLGRHADVSVAYDGRQALEMIEQQAFDLVLMDVHMPVMDGLEATKTLRRLEATGRQRLPVVALTAGATSEERSSCLAAGMDEFVDKPIRPHVLYAKINTIMRAHSSRPPA